MKTIYRSQKGKEEILGLYDAQLARLGRPYKDIYVETSFGKTYLLRGRGHMHFLTDEEKRMIVDFLLE